MSVFQVNGLCAGYGGRHVVKNVAFSLKSGRVMGVLGANGSGKTTLIRSICGILPHEGECVLEGERLESLRPRVLSQKCSYIPQRSGVTIDISALDVVLMGFNPELGLLEHPTKEMRLSAVQALELAGLKGMENRNYLHLSEGQKQLCILARTLVSRGRLLLLDEPESALDFRYRYRMLSVIRQWVQQENCFALVALHDPMLALNDCDELLLLRDGQNIGVIHPQTDSIVQMEQMLSQLYGSISLAVCTNKSGRQQLVMLREGDDAL